MGMSEETRRWALAAVDKVLHDPAWSKPAKTAAGLSCSQGINPLLAGSCAELAACIALERLGSTQVKARPTRTPLPLMPPRRK